MNKTITLTPDEVEMVKDGVKSEYDHYDGGIMSGGYGEDPEVKEYAIKRVRTAESILKKLKDAPKFG